MENVVTVVVGHCRVVVIAHQDAVSHVAAALTEQVTRVVWSLRLAD